MPSNLRLGAGTAARAYVGNAAVRRLYLGAQLIRDFRQEPANQFFTNFMSYAAGEQPADWTIRDSSGTGWQIKQKYGTHVLTALETGSGSAPENQRRFITWNAPGQARDFEVVYLYRTADAGRHARVYARSTGDPDSEQAYELRNHGERIRRIVDGSATSLVEQANGLGAADTLYAHRFRVETLANGNVRLRAKAWQPSDPNDIAADEPAAWDHDLEDDHAHRVLAEGFSGVGCQDNRDFEIDWLFVGVGVNGAAAPVGRVGEAERPPDAAMEVTIDNNVWMLGGQPITHFGLRAVNAMQDDGRLADFLAAMPSMKAHGIQSVSINMQGGRATQGGNSFFNAYGANGDIKPELAERLTRILDAAAEREMVVVVGCFYRGRDQELADDEAVKDAVANTLELIRPWRNAWMNVMNEPDHSGYDRRILTTEAGQVELYQHAKSIDQNRLIFVSLAEGANDGWLAESWVRLPSTPPADGDVSLESPHLDPYDALGVFSAADRSQLMQNAEDTVNAGGYWFFSARWHQVADEQGWPRFDKGGQGTEADPGTAFIWNRIQELAGLTDGEPWWDGTFWDDDTGWVE